MGKEDMQIMVVPTNLLFQDKHFIGFSPKQRYDYENVILQNHVFKRRGDMEIDPSFQQPIPYILLYNPRTKKVFGFQRSNDKNHAHESRLHGKWSWGVGGHIDHNEADSSSNPIHDALLREIKEEVYIDGEIKFEVLGYINVEESEVSKVHFGVLYLGLTNAESIQPKDQELANGKYLTIEELDNIVLSKETDVEEWSIVALKALKEHIQLNN
jgi:predicted NUDIX family phosphoesterase